VRGGAALAAAIRDLNRRLGLPSGLTEMGIGAELYDDVATNALKDHCHATNPRSASHADYVGMLAASA
jgi:alcohol dehydrogenase class IV